MKCGNCVEEFAGQGMNRIGHGMNGMGFGVHWIIGALVVALIVTIILLIVYNKKKKGVSNSEAEETLKMRFVNGEISEEEFQKMKKSIQEYPKH